MLKVVFDANDFVSAAMQKGASHRIVVAWRNGDLDLDHADFKQVAR